MKLEQKLFLILIFSGRKWRGGRFRDKNYNKMLARRNVIESINWIGTYYCCSQKSSYICLSCELNFTTLLNI